MTNITGIIEVAALKQKAAAPNWMSQEEKAGFYVGYPKSFTAGASFATSDPSVLKELLGKFGDWLWRNYKQIDAQVWVNRSIENGPCYTMKDLIEKYIQETIKPKEDEQP